MMKSRSIILVLGLLFVFSINSNAMAQEIKMAVGLALPPYIISEDNSGMEFEIARDALADGGYEMKPAYMPFARVPMALNDKEVDGALTVLEASGLKNVYYSDPYITYQNVAVALEDKNFSINSIGDLSDKKIVAFQNARKYLGDKYAQAAVSSPEYEEKAQQEKQITRLFMDRTDVIVIEANIFKYYRNKVAQKYDKDRVDTDLEVDVFEIFPSTDYKAAFLKREIRNDFNDGIEKLKQSGKYDAIIQKYVSE